MRKGACHVASVLAPPLLARCRAMAAGDAEGQRLLARLQLLLVAAVRLSAAGAPAAARRQRGGCFGAPLRASRAARARRTTPPRRRIASRRCCCGCTSSSRRKARLKAFSSVAALFAAPPSAPPLGAPNATRGASARGARCRSGAGVRLRRVASALTRSDVAFASAFARAATRGAQHEALLAPLRADCAKRMADLRQKRAKAGALPTAPRRGAARCVWGCVSRASRAAAPHAPAACCAAAPALLTPGWFPPRAEWRLRRRG